jgi:uncharacterized repeat protein (TIGR01451 family)
MKRRHSRALAAGPLVLALAAAALPATALADPPSADGGVSGSVPSTLSLTLGAPGSFGSFVPGVAKDYSAAMTANVISTAGGATLSVTDPSATATGHLVNGAFTLPSPLLAGAASPGGSGAALAPVGGSAAPTSLLTYAAPVSNDPVALSFSQHIGATDALRSGSYAKTLTFTLTVQDPLGEQIGVANAADAAQVVAGQNIGFKITVSNGAPFTAQDVKLADDLPAGGNLSWVVDAQSGIAGCAAHGAVGAQSLSCPTVSLAAGASYTLHLLSHTSSSTAATIAHKVAVTTSNLGANTATDAVAVGAANRCQGSAPDTSRTLAFDDEFNGDSVDTTKWTTGTLPFGGVGGSTHYHNAQYGSYILPENVTESDGDANLIANNVPVTVTDPVGTFNYTEGMMHTKGKFSRTGGYFEICAKFPEGKGLWPAFWLAAQNGNWPPEMDIAEWFGSIEGMQIGQPFATGSNAGNMWQSAWFYGNAPTTSFHSYGMWWTTSSPAKILYYVDGQMVHEIDGTTSNLISNTPMYIILNSGTWAPATRGGPPDATTVFPNAFQVDYVRVYTTPPPVQPNSAG